MSDILSGNLSGTNSDIPFASLSDVYSEIADIFQVFWLTDASSDILSGSLSGIYSEILCSGPGAAHCIQSSRYDDVRVQARPIASGARDLMFGYRRGLLHPELAI